MQDVRRQPLVVLLFLFFAATLLSQSVMDAFSIVLSIWVVVVWFKTRKSKSAFALFPRTGLEMLWAAWFSVVTLGYLLNGQVATPWMTRLVEFKWILLLYILIDSFMLIEWSKEKFLRGISWILIICSSFALWKFYIEGQIRLEGLLNAMTYAHMYGQAFCFLFAFGLVAWKILSNRDRILWGMATVITGSSVLLTYTRGVWMGSFVAIVGVGLLTHWIVGGSLLGLGLLVGLGLFVFSPAFHERFIQTFNYQHNYDMERVILWKTNLHIFQQYPLFGIGYGENSRRLREFYDQLGVPAGQFESHAHNQYLHFLAGTGLVGLAIYIFLCGYFFYHSVHLFKVLQDPFKRALALGCVGAQICFYVSGMTESNFEHAKVRMIVMFVWALIIYLKFEHQKNKPLPQ